MKFEIKHRLTGSILFALECGSLKLCLEAAVRSGVDLRGADLHGANLHGANLYAADLYDADLRGCNLHDADLHDADLRDADLRGANLYAADLHGVDLHGADLRGADLTEAKAADYAIAQTRILPEGEIIGWKKCQNSVIVKLRIPEAAKRSHAFGRKCRAEYADVLEIIGADVGVSVLDGKTQYRVGERVVPDSFDDNWMEECSNGVHFFITRIEAENYGL